MNHKPLIRYRWIKRLTFVLAAAPIFQATQCLTGTSMFFQNFANGLPSAYFQTLQSIALLPIQILIGGGTTGAGTGTGTGMGF
jgi:hypothetical protein